MDYEKENRIYFPIFNKLYREYFGAIRIVRTEKETLQKNGVDVLLSTNNGTIKIQEKVTKELKRYKFNNEKMIFIELCKIKFNKDGIGLLEGWALKGHCNNDYICWYGKDVEAVYIIETKKLWTYLYKDWKNLILDFSCEGGINVMVSVSKLLDLDIAKKFN
jgi:hypothetical protein